MAKTYDLELLLTWARNNGGDRVKTVIDRLTGDGTDTFSLTNEGSIALGSVKINGSVEPTSNYEIEGNVVTMNAEIPEGSPIVATYTYSAYSDEDVMSFIYDAARTVSSDLGLHFHVSSTLITDDSGIVVIDNDTLDQTIEKLIALAAGIRLRTDLANQAAGDAIMVKDDDTTIDTSKTAASNEKALARIKDEYEINLRRAFEQFRIPVVIDFDGNVRKGS